MSGPERFFIDTEFIEDGERIHPLAIAVVTEDGDAFYAVVTDVDRSLAGDWVKANVLPYLDEMPPQCDVATRGTRSQVAHALRNWVAMRSDAPEFWADYGAYDWVLVCQLFGTMMDLPDGWPMFVRDIQQLRNGEELPQPEHEHQAVSDALCARDRWRILTAAPAPAVSVEPAWGSVADLRDRLERARRQLDALADDTSDNDEATRLAAKASGVALALSYVNEMPALAAPSPAEPEGPQRERFEPIAVIDPADFVTVRPAPGSTGTGGAATELDDWDGLLAGVEVDDADPLAARAYIVQPREESS